MQSLRSSNLQAGFTLVELSIVLVIIGLIVASVLVGQDLVRQAELRSTVSQYEQYQAAVATFRGKYNGLPGDVAGETNFAFSCATGTADGDGDGVLDDTAQGQALQSGELVFFWCHLGAAGAGMISGSYAGNVVTSADINSQTPRAKAGNNWGVFSTSGVNYYIIGAGLSSAGNNFTTLDTLSPLDAYNIDTKVDDGQPNRGVARAHGPAANDPDANPATGAGGCVDATTADGVYQTTVGSLACTLSIKMIL